MRPGCTVFTAAAALLTLGAESAKAQQPVTAFEHVAVIPMDRERVLDGQTVVVQGDRIVAMGPASKVRVPAAAARVDGRGKFLMPGLADMHMHLGIPGSGHADLVLFLLLANGVTTIRNVDYVNLPGFVFRATKFIEAEELRYLRARVAAGELLGPRIYTAGEWWKDTTKSVAQHVDAYKAAGWDFIKVHDEPRPMLDSLVDAARRVGLPIAGHPVGGLPYALQHRFASVEHLIGYPGGLASEGTLADTLEIPKLVAMTVEAGTRVTPTLAWVNAGDGTAMDAHYFRGRRYLPVHLRDFYSYLSLDPALPAAPGAGKRSDTLSAAAAASQEVRFRLVRALQAAGVELLLGTDSPFLVPGYGVHQELHALVGAGLTPYQALLTGTRNVASYFGTLDSAGTVAIGKRADLVLLDANPLTDIRHSERIAGVMAAGRWLSAADIERRLGEYADAAAKPTGD